MKKGETILFQEKNTAFLHGTVMQVILCAVQVLMVLIMMQLEGLMPTNSFFCVLFACILWVALPRIPESSRVLKVFAVLLGIMCMLGNQAIMDHYREYYPTTLHLLWYLLAGLAGWFVLWRIFLTLLMLGMEKLKIGEEHPAERTAAGGMMVFMTSLILGVLSWIPYFLCNFPGSIPGDTLPQYQQMLGIVPANNACPWIEMQLIRLCWNIGKGIFGTANAGVAVYTVVSMLAGALTFSYVVWTMYQAGVRRGWRIVLWAFCFLQPFNALYSITVWKDTIFSYLALAFITLLWNKRACSPHWTIANRIAFMLLGFGVCAFRGNGPLVYLLCIPVMLIAFRKEWKPMAAMIAATVAVFGLYYGPLFSLLHIKGMDTIEALSMPSQQIACVFYYEGDVSEEEKALLSKVVDVDQIADTYDPGQADEIKHLVRITGDQTALSEQPLAYLQAYVNIGLKNPFLYAKAIIMQTRGYWYHNIDYYWRSSISLAQGAEDIGISRQSLLPQAAQTAFSNILYFYDHVLFQYCWSIGLTTWTVLFALLYAIQKKHTRIAFAVPIALLLTMFLGVPVFCEFRYVYAVFLAAPPLVLWAMIEPKETEATEAETTKKDTTEKDTTEKGTT